MLALTHARQSIKSEPGRGCLGARRLSGERPVKGVLPTMLDRRSMMAPFQLVLAPRTELAKTTHDDSDHARMVSLLGMLPTSGR